MKRAITITCVLLAGAVAIAGTVTAAWPDDVQPVAHHDAHAVDTAEPVTMDDASAPAADAVCPVGAAAQAAPQSSCCGAPDADANADADAGGCADEH